MNSLAQLGPFARRYIGAAVPAAITEGIVVQGGIEIDDRVKVKTGRNRKSTSGNRGEPRSQDPGPGTYSAPTRADFRDEMKGLKFGEAAALTEGTPYSAAREALDGAVQAGIAAAEGKWKQVGEEAGQAAGRAARG